MVLEKSLNRFHLFGENTLYTFAKSSISEIDVGVESILKALTAAEKNDITCFSFSNRAVSSILFFLSIAHRNVCTN